MGDAIGREVAEGAFSKMRRLPRKDTAQVVGGVAREEGLQRFGIVAMGVECVEKARNGVGNFLGWATVADGARDRSNLADTASETEVVGVDKPAVLLDFLAFQANVGDPVLAARVWAAGDVQLDVFLVAGVALIELFGQPSGKGFGFGEREFAELRAGAGDGATREGVGENGETGGVERFDDRRGVQSGDVDEQKVLHRGGAEMAVAAAVGKIRGDVNLRGGDATTNDGSADGEE